MGLFNNPFGTAILSAASELGVANYFFQKAIVRGGIKREKVMKMSGTDWSLYMGDMKSSGEWVCSLPSEQLFLTSQDGLKLHATWIPREGSKRIAIIFHGYTSKGMDCLSLSYFFLNRGFNVLLPDARAHGESEGLYIGFGVLDRYDALAWVRHIDERFGGNCGIILHGTSLGGATVLMAGGLDLPVSVKGIFSDCAFTSAWDVFASVLSTSYRLPPEPVLSAADKILKDKAGYGLKEVSAADEVRKVKVPLSLVHGEDDSFVPCRMCHEIHQNCKEGTPILIINGAAHGEAYYKNREAYENALSKLISKSI